MSNEHPCCPKLSISPPCDTIDSRYTVRIPSGRFFVDVTYHFRFSRCVCKDTGDQGLVLGDLAYSTTVFPQERVRLFTSDRHSRFTYDTSTQISSRQETTSEESYYMSGMAYAMSNLNILDTSKSSSSYSSSSVSGGGGAGLDLGIFEIGGSVSGSSLDVNTSANLIREISSHAESSSRHIEVGTRAMSSVSIGEVSYRSHSESESEDQYESSSREFFNHNHCHAITYYFYRINKCIEIKFELVSITRKVVTSQTGVVALNPPTLNKINIISSAVPAVSTLPKSTPIFESQDNANTKFNFVNNQVSFKDQQVAYNEVSLELVRSGILKNIDDIAPNPHYASQVFWSRTIQIPTAGFYVRGCLDNCSVCEPELLTRIHLENERLRIENRLLEEQLNNPDFKPKFICCKDKSN